MNPLNRRQGHPCRRFAFRISVRHCPADRRTESDVMNPKARRYMLGGLGAVWLLSACGYAVYLNWDSGKVVPISELAPADDHDETSALWDGKTVVVEGFWVGHFEGHSVSTSLGSWRERGPSLLMRPSSGAGKRGFSLDSILPAGLRRGAVLLSADDRVKITGVFHARGYGAPGTILESCEWLEFGEIKKWDRERGEWKKVDCWY